MITSEQTAREKERLPRGWGRFGKAVDYLQEISDPDESLLSTCVALNPKFTHTAITLAGGLLELFHDRPPGPAIGKPAGDHKDHG